jgi:hypothetical protein
MVPHEDQAKPGHHLQVAAAELNEDAGLAEGQLDPVEKDGAEVLRCRARRGTPSQDCPCSPECDRVVAPRAWSSWPVPLPGGLSVTPVP